MYSTECLFSTIKNISGSTKFYDFLPPYGRELDDEEEFTFIGDPVNAVVRGKRTSSQRYINGLEQAIANQQIEIIKTPNPILYDATAEESQMLSLDDETLGVVDPCWTVSVSE